MMVPQAVSNELGLDQWSFLERSARTASVGVKISPLLRLHTRIAERPGARSLLVLMPAAQSRIERGQLNPLFSRWNWIGDYSGSHVVAISDPALYHDESLSAAWYLSPELDVLESIANTLRTICEVLSLEESAVLVYGSSLGGFGALGVAAHLDGASAVSEIPQLDLERWPVPSALRALEEKILQEPLSEYRKQHPEQVDVVARFRKVGRVPRLRLITNVDDPLFVDHLRFVEDAARLSTEQLPVSQVELTIEDRVRGHHVLSREQVASMLQRDLRELNGGAGD